jgi:hypothetical protein
MRRILLATAAIGFVATLGPSTTRPAHAQRPVTGNSLVFKYNDDDGPGRLTITTVQAAEGGTSTIRVLLEQNGGRYRGSGITSPIQRQQPSRTLYAFSITTQQGAYFFHGETISGITLSGQGTYHRVGSPEREYPWSIVIGG